MNASWSKSKLIAAYDSHMPMRAAFFDVGDTLVEHWIGRERTNELLREALRQEFGERDWYERFLDATVAPGRDDALETAEEAEEAFLRQETLRWYEDWFRNAQIGVDDIQMDRLRVAMTAPLDLVATPVPGAFTAVRWCKESGLVVGLITNTLSRGDDEVWEDWRRFGLADAIDVVVSSHSCGWQKPHRRIFEHALALAGVRAEEAFMVGDRLDADILGAARMGMRSVWRRTGNEQADAGVRPDATIEDLTQLPAVVTPWLGVPSAHRELR